MDFRFVSRMRAWRYVGIAVSALLLAGGAASAPSIVKPFEVDGSAIPNTPLDKLVRTALREKGIAPANHCSDEVFVRRAFLDLIGTLPDATEVRQFLQYKDPDKRAQLIDALMARPEFADYWAMKWCDILRVKAEFPINLWPNAVQAYHRWIRDAVQSNMPYDEFARALLTSSGSNFRTPPVNFYRALQGRQPQAIAEVVSLTLMGTRITSWTPEQRYGLEQFFSRVAYKPTSEWKEEIIHFDPTAQGALETVFPDGTSVRIAPGEDPRKVFANWLITPENPWFARNLVNRAWSWLLGRGIVHEPDDLRPDNPPSNPDLLAYLEKEFVASGYDIRALFRLIMTSKTYQQSSIPQSDAPEAEALFAHYIVRRLDAEVLIDALCMVTETRESYDSPIPEPFTWIPDYQRTIALADASITSSFLETFGRPSRDTGLEAERNNAPTDGQRLHMLNSTHVQRKLEQSGKIKRIVQTAKGNRETIVRNVYLTLLSRNPTPAELATSLEYFKTGGLAVNQVAVDLCWALVNSKEFLYRH